MNEREDIVILGAGMAGFGAAYRLSLEGRRATIFEKNSYVGGHAASFRHPGGWIFDDGPHISFTKVERMQSLFASSVGGRYEKLQARVNNYWKGHWIKHPVCCNLFGLPRDLVQTVVSEIVTLQGEERGPLKTYRDWLTAQYGPTYANTFPMQYGKKFHTTTADNMTTDWCGGRLYRPTAEEVIRGAESEVTADVHYIDHFRYPQYGGFVSYLDMFRPYADVHLNHKVVRIDPRERILEYHNGRRVFYDHLISSLPLPAVFQLLPGVPMDVRAAAEKLAWTSAVLVNLGIDRDDLSPAHWTYFYDEDFVFTRLSFPHMFSRSVVPQGCGSIQAEIYFSDKYKPLDVSREDLIARTVEDLKRCGLMRSTDQVLFSEAAVLPWAQVIYDHERAPSVDILHGYLRDIGIRYCGRFGEWGYHWTDESFMSGERAAESVLGSV